jgi:hypothetical protein
MGSVVDDPAIRPSKHIFVGSRAPWFTITDDLPQYAAHAEAPPAARQRDGLPYARASLGARAHSSSADASRTPARQMGASSAEPCDA